MKAFLYWGAIAGGLLAVALFFMFICKSHQVFIGIICILSLMLSRMIWGK